MTLPLIFLGLTDLSSNYLEHQAHLISSAMNFNYSSALFLKITSVLQKKLLPIIFFSLLVVSFNETLFLQVVSKGPYKKKKCNTIKKKKTVIYSSRMYLGLIFIFITCRSILMSYVKVYIWMTVNRCSRINKIGLLCT